MNELKSIHSGRTAFILCKDQRLHRLLEIELAQCGITLSASEASADLWLVDLDDEKSLTQIPLDVPILAWSHTLANEATHWAQTQKSVCLLKRPFSLIELESCMLQLIEGVPINLPSQKAIQRASQATGSENFQSTSAPLLHPVENQQVCIEGDTVILTPQEWTVFSLLWQHRGNTVSKEMLRQALSASDQEKQPITSNTPEVYICLLRKKLEKPLSRRLITTVRGKGYRLDIPHLQNIQS